MDGAEGPATVLTSEGLDVFFPVHEATSGMDADRHGELVVSGAGCLRVKDGPDDPGVTPVWPSGYEPTNAGERIQILDRRGRVLVSGGDRVVVGGGAITKEQLEQAEADFMDGDVRRELFERCPGLYYLASSVELESRFEKRLDPY